MPQTAKAPDDHLVLPRSQEKSEKVQIDPPIGYPTFYASHGQEDLSQVAASLDTRAAWEPSHCPPTPPAVRTRGQLLHSTKRACSLRVSQSVAGQQRNHMEERNSPLPADPRHEPRGTKGGAPTLFSQAGLNGDVGLQQRAATTSCAGKVATLPAPPSLSPLRQLPHSSAPQAAHFARWRGGPVPAHLSTPGNGSDYCKLLMYSTSAERFSSF